MGREFFDALQGLRESTLVSLDVKGLVIHGCGRHFSSGADLDELRALVAGPGGGEALCRNAQALLALESLPYPTVAAVDGCCLGSGLELALWCRYRVATARAVFGAVEAGFGLIPGCGGTVRLMELVGRAKAVELVLGGAVFGADTAKTLGLVDLIVPRESLTESAVALALAHGGAAGESR
jgi:enoyl-CoA hydratase/carnithine racemase